MDMYGISDAVLHENELHTQAVQTAKLRQDNFKTATQNFKGLQANLTGQDTRSDEKDTAEGLTNLSRVFQVGRATTEYGKGFAAGRPFTRTGMSLGSSHQLGMANLKDVAEVKALPSVVTKDLTGVEGVAQKGLKIAGAGESTAFVGGKALGNIGAGIDVAKGVDNLIQTGNVFKDADTGKMESKTDIAGDLLTVGGGLLDVAAAFTGGLLVPVAAAVNLAGAATSTTGSIEDESSAKTALARKAPVAPPSGPIAPEYETLGFVANISHDPTKSIAAR